MTQTSTLLKRLAHSLLRRSKMFLLQYQNTGGQQHLACQAFPSTAGWGSISPMRASSLRGIAKNTLTKHIRNYLGFTDCSFKAFVRLISAASRNSGSASGSLFCSRSSAARSFKDVAIAGCPAGRALRLISSASRNSGSASASLFCARSSHARLFKE